MTIAETTTGDKGQGPWKSHIGGVLGDWVILGILVLSSSLCFGLGLLTARANAPKGPDNNLWIEQLPANERAGAGTGSTTATGAGTAPSSPQTAPKASEPLPTQPAAVVAATTATARNYVASKTGTKYYLPSCGTVSRIKEENRVYFATKADAESAGYQPSTACKGL